MKIISNRFSHSCAEGVVVVAQEPCRRMIRMEYMDDDNNYSKKFANFKLIDNYYLSFPTVLFSMHYLKSEDKKFVFSYLDLAFSEPIKNRKPKTIYLPALPNVAEDFRVCIHIEKTVFDSLDKMARYVIDSFWQSKFNDTLIDTAYIYEDDYYSGELNSNFLFSLPSWREKTQQDKNWIPAKKDMVKISEENYYIDEFWGNDFPKKKLS